MKEFVKAVGADKVESYSLYGYSATLAFQQAFEAAVKSGGNNNVTRTSVVDGAKRSRHSMPEACWVRRTWARRSFLLATSSCRSRMANGRG